MMYSWDEVRKKYPKWAHPLWQYSWGADICAICEELAEFNVEGKLRIVQGYEDEHICRECYWSKHMGIVDDVDDEVEELDSEDLPPEVMTDGRGNKTLDNW
jgi:hypothetical protein